MNESGRYIFANLTAGAYTVSASVIGFKTIVIKGVVLLVRDAKAEDLVLQTGESSETVTVTAHGVIQNLFRRGGAAPAKRSHPPNVAIPMLSCLP